MLSARVDETFNAITVDSDTSTSDALILAATGRSKAAPITDLASATGQAFVTALHGVMRELAHLVVRDGIGRIFDFWPWTGLWLKIDKPNRQQRSAAEKQERKQ